jgi:competence protein ComEA
VQAYVTGAVARPQALVSVPFGSRVSAVIEAAGGLTDTADLDRVNLAQIVRDGDQIHIYAIEETSAILATPNDAGIVYINVAGVDELVELPRIGPAMAARIIEYRETNGPFTSLDDIDAVSGIGPSTLEEIGPRVSFELR